LVEYNASADTDSTAFDVDVRYLAIVFRKIDDQSVADCAANEAAAGATWSNRDPGFNGSFDDG
jgi:hypothetical protein